MSIYEAVSSGKLSTVDTLPDLPLNTLALLSSSATPQGARDQVAAAAADGQKLATADVSEIIAKAKTEAAECD